MKVVVLTGGKGTRLGLTDRPKPMVLVNGQPLLERTVATAKACGFTEFVFLNGHLGHVIEQHFGDGSQFGVRIIHVREPAALGTAGAIHQARHELIKPFIVLYGDILIDVDLAHFAWYHQFKAGAGCLFVHPNDHPYDSDLVEVANDGRIVGFLPKPHPLGQPLPNLVSAALYVLEPKSLDYVPSGQVSDWGKDVFPAMLAAGERLYAYRSIEYAKDVGTPDRLRKSELDLSSGRTGRLSRRAPKPAVFLDRDGVLNREIDGVLRPEDLELVHGAAEAVKSVNCAGIPAICITNQPALAKGQLTLHDLRAVFAALDTKLAAHRAYLDHIYFCPHHPERGWPGEVAALKIACTCRKPAPGLLLQAAEEHHLDLSRSWLIGDRYSDVAAAQAAGARGLLLARSGADNPSSGASCTPDYVANGITEAVTYVLSALGVAR